MIKLSNKVNKIAGNTGWIEKGNVTNVSGFSSLPAGTRTANGVDRLFIYLVMLLIKKMMGLVISKNMNMCRVLVTIALENVRVKLVRPKINLYK